jgi:hypothetical protein
MAIALAIATAVASRRAGGRGLTYAEGPGVQLTPSTVLHMSAATEVGYDSNPGYTEQGGAAAFMRLMLRADWASRPPQRLAGPGTPARRGIDFRLGLSAERLEYLGEAAAGMSAWQLDESARLEVNPQGTIGGSAFALYGRSILPKNYEPIGTYPRDVVGAGASLVLRPRHSRMSYTLGYEFAADWFEASTLAYAKNLRSTVRATVRREVYYRLSVALELSVGHISYDAVASPLAKADSTPLTVVASVTGVLRPRLTGTLKLGYANGFYDTLPNLANSNLSSPTVEAEATYQVIPQTGRLSGGYGLLAQDALMGDYYIDHLVYLRYDQLLAMPRRAITVSLRPSYRHRTYHGEPVGFTPRDDDILEVQLAVEMSLKDWLLMGLGYDVSADFTGFRDPAGIPYGFVKHMVFAKVQVSY